MNPFYILYLFIRFDNITLEFNDVDACFDLLKKSLQTTAAEPYFLSILQHLICIRNEGLVRPAYYKLIEECVNQIVLHRSGCDPDFAATKRFQIDVSPLLDKLMESPGPIQILKNHKHIIVIFLYRSG